MRMKNLMMIALAMVLFFVFTGDGHAANIRWGVRGGGAFTKIRNCNGYISSRITADQTTSTASRNMMGPGAAPVSSDFGFKWGWVGGLFLKYEVTDRLAVELDVLYSQKGAKSSDSNVKVKINYIEVPILLNVRVKDRLRLVAGPYIAFKVKSRCTFSDVENGEVLKRIDLDVVGTDAGITVGGNFKFRKSPKSPGFVIAPRFSLGFAKIFKDTAAANEIDEKNLTVTIMVGYEF